MELACKSPETFNFRAEDTEGEWKKWRQQFEIYLVASGLDNKAEKRKTCMLLHLLGQEGQKLYNTFTWRPGTDDVAAEDRDDLTTVFTKFDAHFAPKRNLTVKRQSFLNRNQGENEAIMDFVADLRDKASACEYGDLEDSLIVDRIIQGIRDRKTKMRLMDAEEITLDRALRICRTAEDTNKYVNALETPSDARVYAARDIRAKNSQRGTRNRYSDRGARGNTSLNTQPTCERCGLVHRDNYTCPAIGRDCRRCGRVGHFAIKCRTSDVTTPRGRAARAPGRPGAPRYTRRVYTTDVNKQSADGEDMGHVHDGQESEYYTEDSEDDSFYVYNVNANMTDMCDDEWLVEVEINKKSTKLLIDTGARASILSKRRLRELDLHVQPLQQSHIRVRLADGKLVKPAGRITLPCRYGNTELSVEFEILDSDAACVLSAHHSKALGLIQRLYTIQSTMPEATKILETYKDVFEGIGCIDGEYKIKIDPNVEPTVHPPRTIPVAIRNKVKQELDRMVDQRIIEPVQEPTEWVNSLHVVVKPNKVRVVIDPIDLNRAILREHHPMMTIEDVATRINGSKIFTVLDANQGFFQIPLEKESTLLTTFNTPFGRYKYLRLPMGIRSAPDVYQRAMTDMFGDLEGVECIVDDLLIHAPDEVTHNIRLHNVLQRARDRNLRFNPQKTKVGLSQVDYVGHVITSEGLKASPSKIEAILDMPDPGSKDTLGNLLGMLTYLGKFIPNLSQITAPLRLLMQKDIAWHWGQEQIQSMKQIRETLTKAPVLKYYSTTHPITVSCDSSSHGLGAVILQHGHPVAYASKALTAAEQRYAQIEKEMLAIVYATTKFHHLIYGRQDVAIETDHKPLETIFQKPLHKAPMRLQKMMLKLQPYSLKVKYIPGKDIPVADALSRIHSTRSEPQLVRDEDMVCVADVIPFAPEKHVQLRDCTSRDNELTTLIEVIRHGWPENRHSVEATVRQYWDFRDELSVYDGIVFRGSRVIIPVSLRPEMLNRIHEAHMGIVKCKQRARDVLFWPGMNGQIEDIVSKCSICLTMRNKQQKEPLMSHEIPTRPWAKVATDLFELRGEHYLVMVDYYSSFFEVAQLRDTTASTVIGHLKANMARYGIVDELVSDNGPQFSSREFKQFAEMYEFKHTTSSPRFPQSNGMAERAVQTAKRLIEKAKRDKKDFYLALLDYRNTPQDNDVGSPAQRLMGRRTKTRLPTTEALLRPQSCNPRKIYNRLESDRESQKKYYDRSSKSLSKLHTGDIVRMQTDSGWRPAKVIDESPAPRSHIVESNGRVYRRNRRMLMKTRETRDPTQYENNMLSDELAEGSNTEVSSPICRSGDQPTSPISTPVHSPGPPEVTATRQIVTSRGRVVNPPARFKDFVRV